MMLRTVGLRLLLILNLQLDSTNIVFLFCRRALRGVKLKDKKKTLGPTFVSSSFDGFFSSQYKRSQASKTIKLLLLKFKFILNEFYFLGHNNTIGPTCF